MATIAAPAVEAGLSARRSVTLSAVAVAGGVAAAATAANLGSEPDTLSIVRGLLVASYVFVGLYTWWHRPTSRFGAYLAGVGGLYVVVSLSGSDDSLPYTVGRVALAVLVVALVYVFLCFPHDNLASRLERRLVAGLAFATTALWLLALPLVEKLPAGGPLTDCDSDCPDNALQVVVAPEGLSSGIGFAVNAVTAVGLLAVAALLVGKARSPGLLRRRLTVPLLACVVLLTVNYAAFTLLQQADLGGTEVLRLLGGASALAVPLAMLVGQVRGRVFAATSLGRLVARVGAEPVSPARVEILLREALGDTQLKLALRHAGRTGWVDVRGRAIELPTGGRDVATTSVLRNGWPVAVLIHDAALKEDTGITEGLAATSLMLLENAQLVEDLQASRARIVASEQRERLRLERNLHDGAQQRLFSIQLKLEAARQQTDDAQLGQDLRELADDASSAVDELRELAHGLYPTVLRERGLGDGLRSLARTAAANVTVDADRSVDGHMLSTVEEAVYFCAREAIQNATKHAGAGARVTVTLARRGTDLQFAIEDDGVGFDPDGSVAAMGFVSMRDRIGAVGGDVEIVSQTGRGTTVRGVVPRCWPTDEEARHTEP